MEAPIIQICKLVAAPVLSVAALTLAAMPAHADTDLTGPLTTYVKARAAGADGDSAFAAKAYGDVLAAVPDDSLVAIRAYREALTAGDMPLALKAEAALAAQGKVPADGTVLVIADQIARRDYSAAEKSLARLNGTPFNFMMPIISAWIRYDSDPAAAIKQLNETRVGSFGRRYVMESLALMEVASGKKESGVARLQTLSLNDAGMLDMRVAAARLLAGRGDRDMALTLIQGDDSAYVRLRQNLDGVKGGAAYGVARLYARLASELNSDQTRPLAIVLARAALLMDDKADYMRLLLTDALSKSGDFQSAKAALSAIPARSIYADATQLANVVLLDRAGEEDEALKAAELLAQKGSGDDIRVYATLLNQNGKFAEAAKAFARARAAGGAGPDWLLMVSQGSALDRAGDWDAAYPLLKQAVALAPKEPLVLNYLGYALLERKQDLAEAQRLIEQAYALKPDNPSIVDSLAWAYFVRGDPAKALPLIEDAVRAKPADSDIQEHLGDIYWALGRRFEARYAWRAASIYAEGEQAARIKAKLADGPATAQR